MSLRLFFIVAIVFALIYVFVVLHPVDIMVVHFVFVVVDRKA